MGCNLTVDLFGEQTVQVITALLQAACVLAVAMLVVLLSVRSKSAGAVPVRAIAPVHVRLSRIDRINRPADQALRSALPARAPPDPDHSRVLWHDHLPGS